MSMHPDRPIPTNSARHVMGAPRVRGYDVYGELVGEDFWSQLSLSIGFKRLSCRQCEILDTISSCLLVADPRIWFLRAARICASFGRIAPGLATTSLLLETTSLSGSMKTEVPDFYQAYRVLSTRHKPDAIALARTWFEVHDGRPPGFDNQAQQEDERHTHIAAWLETQPEEDGDYVRIHHELSDLARQDFDSFPNFVSLVAALMLDMGFSPEHVPPFILTMMNINTLNNVVEASLQKSEDLRTFPQDNVRYAGPEVRRSPRALAAERR